MTTGKRHTVATGAGAAAAAAKLLTFTALQGAALDDTVIAALTEWLRNVRSTKHAAAARDVTPRFKK